MQPVVTRVAREVPADPERVKSIIAETPKHDLSLAREHFDSRLPVAASILNKLGIHRNSGMRDHFNPFTNETVRDDFSNIHDHLVFVAEAFRILSDPFVATGQLSGRQQREGIIRAYWHDGLKVFDVFYNKALKAGLVDVKENNSAEYFKTIESALVENYGFGPRLAQYAVLNWGKEVVSSSVDCMRCYLRFDRGGLLPLADGPLIDKLIFLSDNLSCSVPKVGNMVLTCEERLLVAGTHTKAPIYWQYGYGVRDGELVAVENCRAPPHGTLSLGSVHGNMITLSSVISREVCNSIGLTAADADQALKEYVTGRVSAGLSDRTSHIPAVSPA